MSSIVDRLRQMADLFEAQHSPHNLVLYLRAAADEIERLRAGGCARDQSTTQYCAEAARLAEENKKLRAALQTIADMTDYGTETATWRMTSAIHNANVIARAALEGRDD